MQSIINEALKNAELEKGMQTTSIVDDEDMLGQPRIVIVGCGGAGNNTINRLHNMKVGGAETIAITVYGPAGRPDMAYFNFTNQLIRGETIQIFNYGNCQRDFTFVDDIVEGVKRVMTHIPEKKNGEDGLPLPPYALYNIGNSKPENLLDFVQILSEELVSAGVLPEDYDFEAHKELVPMQPGDVPMTYADTEALEKAVGFRPNTPLREGLRKFARWYKDFYKV